MRFYRVMFLLFVVLASFGSTSGGVSVDNCAMERITVPIMEHDGKVTLAASFMYGQYAPGAKDIGSMFNSKKLDERLGAISESAKERCPEYVILKRFRLTKEGKPEQAIKYYEPGYSRETALRYLGDVSKYKDLFDIFTEVVFLDKSYFGPYVRIYYFMREVRADKKKGKGFPASAYLKRQTDGRYLIADDKFKNQIFDDVVSYYSYNTIIKKQNIEINSDISNMKMFAIDIDKNSLVKDKKLTLHYGDIDPNTSDNRLLIYLDCEPINIEIIGASEDKLSKELAFLKAAEMAYWAGDKSKILPYWTGNNSSRKVIEKRIKNEETLGDWPLSSLGYGQPVRKVIALLRCDLGTTVYYRTGSADPLKTVTILEKSKGDFLLSRTYFLGDNRKDILLSPSIAKAIEKIYVE